MRVGVVVLFCAAALISGFSLRRGIDPFDEGLVLQAAARVSDGQLPYADFLWSYGPGAPYLLAGLRELLGPSLLDWRILRVLVGMQERLAVPGLCSERQSLEALGRLQRCCRMKCRFVHERSTNRCCF